MTSKKPPFTDKVSRGMEVLRPVISLMLDQPSESELQDCTTQELSDAAAAPSIHRRASGLEAPVNKG
jgi:hypothetical protein